MIEQEPELESLLRRWASENETIKRTWLEELVKHNIVDLTTLNEVAQSSSAWTELLPLCSLALRAKLEAWYKANHNEGKFLHYQNRK
jgi:hypothetical protein